MVYGIALERHSLVQDAIIRGELVQLTPFTALLLDGDIAINGDEA
ncbi:hypothetical protein ACVXBK_004189 [Citrobacter koseri]